MFVWKLWNQINKKRPLCQFFAYGKRKQCISHDKHYNRIENNAEDHDTELKNKESVLKKFAMENLKNLHFERDNIDGKYHLYVIETKMRK